MNSRTCYFFVDDIASSFVQTELQNLATKFNKVVVVTKSGNSQNDSNFEFVSLSYQKMNSFNNFFSNFFLIVKIYVSDLDLKNLSINFNFIKHKLSSINRAVYLANLLNDTCEIEKGAVYYSFWMNEWASVLSILKQKNKISGFVSRIHGADLYEERVPVFKKLVLRKFQLQNVSKVFSISNKGGHYLKDKYRNFKNKIFTSYLGTNDFGPGYFDKNHVFTIVSVAKVRNIKRIYMIPEILMNINFPVKWIHIGDENLSSNDSTIQTYLNNKKLLKSKPNIEVVTLGNTTNEQVLQFYKSNNVNLFISVSETEGLPISMMEAMSFGIPILSTNVGGCSEIVNETTGVLIEKNFDVMVAANKILEIKNSKLNSEESRLKIREYWKANFSNETNFNSFIDQL